MKIKSFKANKLIRDQVPNILRARGIVVYERVMEKEEFIQKLKDKLLEEAKEVGQAQNIEELLEELADVVEVIQTLSSATGLTMEEIEKMRIKKRQLKGGFEEKIFNSHIDINEDNPEIAYYLNKPTQYPQINHETHQSDCVRLL